MKLFLGGLVVLVVGKYAIANGYHMGILSSLLLWWLLSLIWPKHITSPMAQGKRLLKASVSRRIRMPLFGWMLWIKFPLALPFFLFIWLWSARYKHLKGKHRPLGRRLRRQPSATWTWTTYFTGQMVRFVLMVRTVVGSQIIRATQALQGYRHRRAQRHQPVSTVVRRDGDWQDQSSPVSNKPTN